MIADRGEMAAMENMMEKANSCNKIIFTLFGFVVFWAIVTDAWGYSDYIFRNNPHNIGTYIYGYISRCIWVIPALLLIIIHSDKLKLHKHELYQHAKFDKPLMIVIAISFVYVVIGMLINHKGLWFNSEIFLGLVLVKYIVVGFVEETVFRGWGYNSLANIVSHKKAAIITTVFFVLLHWSAYFIKLYRFGIFDFTGLIGQSSSALIWGFVFCWLLKNGKTLWNPILAHILYDLTYVLLVGGN